MQTKERLYTRDLMRSISSVLVVTEMSGLAYWHWHGSRILFAGFPLDVRNSCQGHGLFLGDTTAQAHSLALTETELLFAYFSSDILQYRPFLQGSSTAGDGLANVSDGRLCKCLPMSMLQQSFDDAQVLASRGDSDSCLSCHYDGSLCVHSIFLALTCASMLGSWAPCYFMFETRFHLLFLNAVPSLGDIYIYIVLDTGRI